MGVKRLVNTDFWNDEKVLDFTVEDKYFMLYLLTNPQSRQLGVYKLPKKIISFQTGYTVECICNLLDRFQNVHKMILYNDETQEIAIKNYLKHSIITGGKPLLDCLAKDISFVSDINLIGYVKESLEQITSSEDKPIYKNILELLKDFKYIQNENDILHTHTRGSSASRGTTRQRVVKPSEIKPSKIQYAEFVHMSETEYSTLIEKIGEQGTKRCIEILDNYKGANGKKYASDYRAILNWVIKRYEEEKQKPEQSNNIFFDMLREEGYNI